MENICSMVVLVMEFRHQIRIVFFTAIYFCFGSLDSILQVQKTQVNASACTTTTCCNEKRELKLYLCQCEQPMNDSSLGSGHNCTWFFLEFVLFVDAWSLNFLFVGTVLFHFNLKRWLIFISRVLSDWIRMLVFLYWSRCLKSLFEAVFNICNVQNTLLLFFCE